MTNLLVHELVDLLALERLRTTCSAVPAATSAPLSTFYGQVLGQALSAAQRTVDDARRAHIPRIAYFCAPATSTPRSFTPWTARATARVFPCDAWWRSSTASPSSTARSVSARRAGRGSTNCPCPKCLPEDLDPPAPIPPEELGLLIPVKVQRWLRRRPFEFSPRSLRSELAAQAAALPAGLVPRRPRPGRPRAAPRHAGLCVRPPARPPSARHLLPAQRRWRALITRCGSIAPSAWTNGCQGMPATAPRSGRRGLACGDLFTRRRPAPARHRRADPALPRGVRACAARSATRPRPRTSTGCGTRCRSTASLPVTGPQALRRRPVEGFSYRGQRQQRAPWVRCKWSTPTTRSRQQEVIKARPVRPGSRRADDYAAAVAPRPPRLCRWSVANRVRLRALRLVGPVPSCLPAAAARRRLSGAFATTERDLARRIDAGAAPLPDHRRWSRQRSPPHTSRGEPGASRRPHVHP